jgi:hypothetical protein
MELMHLPVNGYAAAREGSGRGSSGEPAAREGADEVPAAKPPTGRRWVDFPLLDG